MPFVIVHFQSFAFNQERSASTQSQGLHTSEISAAALQRWSGVEKIIVESVCGYLQSEMSNEGEVQGGRHPKYPWYLWIQSLGLKKVLVMESGAVNREGEYLCLLCFASRNRLVLLFSSNLATTSAFASRPLFAAQNSLPVPSRSLPVSAQS